MKWAFAAPTAKALQRRKAEVDMPRHYRAVLLISDSLRRIKQAAGLFEAARSFTPRVLAWLLLVITGIVAHGEAQGSGAGVDICSRFEPGAVVSPPPQLSSQNGVLELTFRFQSMVDAQGLIRYCYLADGGFQAPTLRVKPGDRLVIHFHNELPAAGSSSRMRGMMHGMPMPQDAQGACNSGMMTASSTNVHFHGLNVPPSCHQDDALHTLIDPSQSFDYEVQIPANEPPGLYWYHPHPHGFSETQVQGGASGALIVEGIENVDTSLRGLTERLLVLRDQQLPASTSDEDDPARPAWDISINYVPVTYPNYVPATIEMRPGRKELWRVLNAAAGTIFNLQLVTGGVAQPVEIVAADGVPLISDSGDHRSQKTTNILLPPGARAEFLATAPGIGEQSQLVTQAWDTGPDGDGDPMRPIANIVSQDGAPEAASALASAGFERLEVTRFTNLSNAVPVAQRKLFFSEEQQDPANPDSPTEFYLTVEGQQPMTFQMDAPPNIVVHQGTVEDWIVENRASEDHVFHIHQIHFRVLEVNGQPVFDPAVRDTIDLPYWSGSGPFPSVKLRMDFSDSNIVGTFVYHCHILEHEDGGMMGSIQVLPPALASTTTLAASATTINVNADVEITAVVAPAVVGSAAITGTVQFSVDGADTASPVPLFHGRATLHTVFTRGGTHMITAAYSGDSNYAGSVSDVLPMTVADFILTAGHGPSLSVGQSATVKLSLAPANGFNAIIHLACFLPVELKAASCSITPGSVTGGGEANLAIDTAPAKSLAVLGNDPLRLHWFDGRGIAMLSSALLVAVAFRRRRLLRAVGTALLTCLALLIGCGGSAGKYHPRMNDTATIPAGTYAVMVTATSGTAPSQIQKTVEVSVTIR